MIWVMICVPAHISRPFVVFQDREHGGFVKRTSASLSPSTDNWSALSNIYYLLSARYLQFNSDVTSFSGCLTVHSSPPLCVQAVHPWQFQDVGRVNCAGPTYPHSLMTGKNPRLPSKTLTSTWVRSVFILVCVFVAENSSFLLADSAPWSLSHHANY